MNIVLKLLSTVHATHMDQNKFTSSNLPGT